MFGHSRLTVYRCLWSLGRISCEKYRVQRNSFGFTCSRMLANYELPHFLLLLLYRGLRDILPLLWVQFKTWLIEFREYFLQIFDIFWQSSTVISSKYTWKVSQLFQACTLPFFLCKVILFNSWNRSERSCPTKTTSESYGVLEYQITPLLHIWFALFW